MTFEQQVRVSQRGTPTTCFTCASVKLCIFPLKGLRKYRMYLKWVRVVHQKLLKCLTFLCVCSPAFSEVKMWRAVNWWYTWMIWLTQVKWSVYAIRPWGSDYRQHLSRSNFWTETHRNRGASKRNRPKTSTTWPDVLPHRTLSTWKPKFFSFVGHCHMCLQIAGGQNILGTRFLSTWHLHARKVKLLLFHEADRIQ